MSLVGEQHGGKAAGAPRLGRTLHALVAALACLGCKTGGEPSEPCPGRQPPAFVISVSALEGPLPDDVSIRLAYGGGEDEYTLSERDPGPSVMFCSPQADRAPAGAGGAAGAAGMSPSSAKDVSGVVCEVWVEGAVTVWVTGGGYEPLVTELSGEANDCGPVTVEAELVLGAPVQDDE